MVWLLGAVSAVADVRFEKLTIQEGYPGAFPISIAQDNQGFLWIADFDAGLIRCTVPDRTTSTTPGLTC
jgi:hypothetical protein